MGVFLIVLWLTGSYVKVFAQISGYLEDNRVSIIAHGDPDFSVEFSPKQDERLTNFFVKPGIEGSSYQDVFDKFCKINSCLVCAISPDRRMTTISVSETSKLLKNVSPEGKLQYSCSN